MEIITEGTKTYLKGIMTEANFGTNGKTDFSFRGRNRNGRLYEYEICKKATLELKERVDKGGVLSYLGHPNHSDLIYEDSCGKIIELDWIEESGRAHCKIELLEDTKDGKLILKEIKDGKPFGISTRGQGSLDENKMVKEGLSFLTSDLIKQYNGSLQSCQSCSLSLTESVQSDLGDYLLNVDTGDCYLDLSESDKQIVKENLKNKIISIIK